MKKILLLSMLLPVLAAQSATPDGEVDTKAKALEAELSKSLDSSPRAAKAMLELVNLYHANGRVFGLVRVGERFAKAQSTHAQHRAVMLKLLDGLEVMTRRDDFITYGREYLSRYANSAEAINVVTRLGDALVRNNKRIQAADAYRALWLHRPIAANRVAGQRASELYVHTGNGRIRIRAAQMAESLLDKLPANEFTLRAGFRAVHEYRAISKWAEANSAAQKMFKKGLPLTRRMQRELHELMSASYASQSQWANSVASLKQARALGDRAELHLRQISHMYNAGLKAAQIGPEVAAIGRKFPGERARWEAYYWVGHAHAREGNAPQAARYIAAALPHASSANNMPYYYVTWLVDGAANQRNSAQVALNRAQTNIDNAKKDETAKRIVFNKARPPDKKKAAQAVLMAASKLVQLQQQELTKAAMDLRTKQAVVNPLVAEADRTLSAALTRSKADRREFDVLALRHSLARTLYIERAKDEARGLTHARAALQEVHLHNGNLNTLVSDLLTRQADGGQFRADSAMLLKQRRDHITVSYYRDYVSNWMNAMRRDKTHRGKSQYLANLLAKENQLPEVSAALKFSRPQDNVKNAIPLRDRALAKFNTLSKRNQFHLIGTQRGALISYAKKRDPERAKKLTLQLFAKHPRDYTAAMWVVQGYLNDKDKVDAKKYAQQILRLPPMASGENPELARALMQSAEINQDAALANQVYQWLIKGRPRTWYGDYIGDVLFKLGQQAQARDWWQRVVVARSEGRAEERHSAERLLRNGGTPPAALREEIDFRWPEMKLRIAAHRATDLLRLQGNAKGFADAIKKLEAQSVGVPFANGDWHDFASPWRDFAYNNKSYVESKNPAYKGFKELDDPARQEVYRAIRGLRGRDFAAWAACDLLLMGGVDADSPMERLLVLVRVTKTTYNDHNRWNTFRSYAQKAFEQKRYVESATLLTGMLAHITSVPKEVKEAGRGAVLRAHSRMGAVGLTIDEDSPMAPLLQAALYLRLGDKDKALELYQTNAELFKEHRNNLPPDLIQFVCNHLMAGGGEENLLAVEDTLRGWLVKFTDPDKPESKEQSLDAKAGMQLLLAKSYFKSQRYDVARAEYATVTNRYAGTPHAIEARFGIGESYMAQRVFDQASMIFKELEDNGDLRISVRAEFLTGLLAFRQEQHDVAREKFKHILERVPDVELANRTLFELSNIYGLEQRYLQQLNLLRTVGRLGQHSKRLHTPGNALSIVVHDRDLGVSRGQARIPVVVTTKPGGDRELVYLRSTAGAGKGLFRGEIDTTLGTVTQGDGVLQLTGRDVIESDYPVEFKKQFRTVPLSDVEIRIAANGEFDVASSEIVDEKKETLTERLQREQQEQEDADQRVSQDRPPNQVKPGNRIFLRVKDADRDLGDEVDKVLVTLRADSGDAVQVELEETGSHTGEFKAAIPTAELPAGAAATDSSIDHNPLMAIDHSRESFWQSEPDGQTPKSLTVDMKQVHAISRMRVSTPNAAENTPVRSTVLGSHDGVFWFQLAANPGIPRAEPVADAIGAMTQRVFKGDFTGYTQWQQIAQLAKTGKPVAEANATELAWGIPMGEPGAAEPYAALWHGQLVQRKDGALRIVVRGDMVAVAVDGRLELAPSTTAAQRPVDLWLKAGLHEVVIFAATKQAQRGMEALRVRSNPNISQPRPVAFNQSDFDLDAATLFFGVADNGADPKSQPIASDTAQFAFNKKTETFGLVNGTKPETKVVSNWKAPEDTLQWKFNAAKPGVYEVWLNLAHQGGGSHYRLTFGDQVIESATPNTGNWNTYRATRIGAIHIEDAGAKALTIAPVEIANGGLMALAGIELRPAVGENVILRDRSWEFFFHTTPMRYVQFRVHEYLGDSVAVNHVEVRGPEAAPIPTKEDVSQLATNNILEIAGGDTVTASYTDDTAVAVNGGSRLLTSQLQATYFNARVVPIAFDFTRNAAGQVQQTRKELMRVDPGERVTFEVVDYDMDQSDERDKVPVSIFLNGRKWKDLEAVETEEYSGTFRVEVDTAAAPADGKLVIQRGDTVICRYTDVQNTFPGNTVDREGEVFANQPTEGRLRIIETRVIQPPPESTARPRPEYLPKTEEELPGDHLASVNFFVPLTVEIIDPDAAKDSLSTVKIILNAGTTNEVEVTCALSTQFGDFSNVNTEQINAALMMGRFIGQVKMQLGGEGSPTVIPRALGENLSLVGRARIAGTEDEDDTPNNLIYTVLNVNGKSTIATAYEDATRPDGQAKKLTALGRLVTDGTLAVTEEDYKEPVELLHVGEKLYVVITDPDLDISNERDTAEILIKSESGELEKVSIAETLSHSGVFTGSLELKATEKPTATNFDDTAKQIECFFGDQLNIAYTDLNAGTPEGNATLAITVPVAIGTDGLVSAFSKIFGNQKLAVQTQFHIAESYFELFKNNLALERKNEAEKALEAGRRMLKEIMVDFPDPKYLPRIAYLNGQFSQELKDWNEAANSYALIVRQYPNHTLAADAQYKLAQCYEEAKDFDRALEEYVTLAATYPKSPLIPKTMIRINEYFYKRENYKIAAKVAEKFMERFSDHDAAPKMAFRWGQCYYKADNFARAAEVFDLFIKKFPDDTLSAQSIFWSGESWRMANNVPQAFRRYNRCRWDFPESEAAQFARGRLALPEMLAQFEAEANSVDNDN
jgi:TolA-binding protein